MMIIKKHKHLVALLMLAACWPMAISAAPGLSLKDFIQRATQNDTRFEAILIDQLPLPHRRDALLPDSDVILDVKHQHNFYLDQERDNPESTLSLSKLFPYNGTEVSLAYSKSSSSLTETDDSSLQFLISQPIAKNAFGKGYRLREQIIGIENDVIRHQIVEAYEDYLASLTAAYYNWYTAYENIKVGQASLQSSQKLLDEILERQRQKVALPIDVNKMKLLLIGKKESLIILQELYDNLSNLIFKAIRHKGTIPYRPMQPGSPARDVRFNEDYEKFTQSSRTYKILRRLEQQGTLQVKQAADDLLPSNQSVTRL